MIKNDKEIADIRRACEITDLCFTEILKAIKPGVTEKKIAFQLEKLFSKYGVEPAFPVIVAFGKHTSMVHYLDAKKSITRAGIREIILLDFGVKVNGYCSDMTRMVFVGKPQAGWIRAYDAIRTIQQSCIDKIRVLHGKHFSGASMDRFARALIKKANLPPYPHGLGHNLGRKIHELPRLSRKKDAQIVPGMVFTIEPGTYIKNAYGIRIEDTVLLKKNGIEILTKSPKTMLCL
jgi:Xaa-Pro aminopeptidase